tara:strand:- start:189 stop:401 length:213 start_codon:yes stop_codon:yes gene_type:complete
MSLERVENIRARGMSLVCGNNDCESHEDESYCFNVTVTVNPYKKLSEDVSIISSEYFECVYCNAVAKDSK